MNMKRKQAVVMSAPRLEGDSIPSMATTEEGVGERERQGLQPEHPVPLADRAPAQGRLDEAPFSLRPPLYRRRLGLSWGSEGCSSYHTSAKKEK